jgi:hypothetical protein
MKDSYQTSVFNFNDSVEAQSFDPLNRRLVVASHSGVLKMFGVENACELGFRSTFAIPK